MRRTLAMSSASAMNTCKSPLAASIVDSNHRSRIDLPPRHWTCNGPAVAQLSRFRHRHEFMDGAARLSVAPGSWPDPQSRRVRNLPLDVRHDRIWTNFWKCRKESHAPLPGYLDPGI